jgi:hypothetical protein
MGGMDELIVPLLGHVQQQHLLPGDPLLTLDDVATFHGYRIFGRPVAHPPGLYVRPSPVFQHRLAPAVYADGPPGRGRLT